MPQFLLIFVFSLFLLSCDQIKTFLEKSPATIQTEEEKTSYLLGYILADNIKKSEAQLQGPAFLQGVRDSINNQPSVLEPEDAEAIHKQIQQKAFLEKQKRVGEQNKVAGQKFLEENKKREGVQVTASGLQYEVLTEGKGRKATAESEVEVHYRGTLIDGTEFDSSYKNNSTVTFPLNSVIKGWTEGLQLMKEGAKYKFYIPSDLAYGEKGAGQNIPPHSTLIFEVHLIKVK